MRRSSLWSISWLRHQMFHLYIAISAAQAHESDDLFWAPQRILGYVRPRRIVAVHPPETGKRRPHCDVIGLQMLLRTMQTMNWDTASVNPGGAPTITFLHVYGCWSARVWLLLPLRGSGKSDIKADSCRVKCYHNHMQYLLFIFT